MIEVIKEKGQYYLRAEGGTKHYCGPAIDLALVKDSIHYISPINYQAFVRPIIQSGNCITLCNEIPCTDDECEICES